ncbi:MAG: hypothetical protein JW761_10560, partial [Prolixibacteraceae bacterium]|nr:hypothetical protein [Prolixibacteraceae bacterium]
MDNQKKDKNRITDQNKKPSLIRILKKYFRVRSSIYARVVYIIIILTVFLFFSYGAIFKSVYEDYLNTVIRQRGDNIGSIIEGS